VINIPFELHIALRYLLAKRKQAFISVISFISTLGVAVGVMALVIAMALTTGLQDELRDKILGSYPHLFVWKKGESTDFRADIARLRQVPHVVGAAPAVLGKALVSAAGESAFINLKGVDPALEPSVTAIGAAMRSGSLDALGAPAANTSATNASAADALDAILLGTDLAAELGVMPGDSLTMMTTEGTLSPMGLIPRQRKLRVAGTFNLGFFEVDSQTGFVSLDVAKRLLGKQDIDTIQLRLDNIYSAREVSASIERQLGADYTAQDWTEMNKSLFSALWLERMAISAAIGLIVIVAALNIIASLILLVMEKHRDIGILKTMGASARSVMAVFMMQGLIIGIVGTGVGAIGGCVLSILFDRYRLISMPADVYQVSYLPFKLVAGNIVAIVASAIAVCFVATLYPSRQAARLDPAQALRYE
jgi:lipoprotein-releasing system permease protein